LKIEILSGKNPTEIHSALSEVCGELTVDRSTVSRWASRFRGSCVTINDDPRPGRPKTSTDEGSVKLVSDALEEDRHVTCEVLSETTGIPPTSIFRILTNDLKKRKISARWMLEAGPIILHDNARPHIENVAIETLRRYGWEVLPHAPYSSDMSPPDFDLFSKLKQPMRGRRFPSLEELSAAVPEPFDR
ncbi:hypothetical protein B7P43_G09436, partial [Cryptotermes secundus]